METHAPEPAHRMGPPQWEPGDPQDGWTNRCLGCGERWTVNGCPTEVMDRMQRTGMAAQIDTALHAPEPDTTLDGWRCDCGNDWPCPDDNPRLLEALDSALAEWWDHDHGRGPHRCRPRPDPDEFLRMARDYGLSVSLTEVG